MTRAISFLAIAAALAVAPALANDAEPPRWKGWCDLTYPLDQGWPPRLNLPAWVCEVAFAAKAHERYTPYTKINPFFLSGDFDGDGRLDAAVWIENKKSHKLGIMIFRQGNKQPTVIGAGVNFADRGDDYAGLDVWSIIPKGEVLKSTWEGDRKLVLRGDALFVGKSESASVAIYWTGKTYAFYQITD